MLSLFVRRSFLMLCVGIFLACDPETESIELIEASSAQITPTRTQKAELWNEKFPSHIRGYSLWASDLHSVAPSECGATKFSEVLGKYYWDLATDPVASQNMEQYLYLNRQAAILGIGSDFFGKNGEYTTQVKKLERDLERFWQLPREVKVLGQHNQTLNDREKLADIFWFSVQDLESRAEAYKLADEIIKLNRRSPVLPESPILSSDGFSALRGTIVIGDGLIQLFTETGLSAQIVLTGILSHEWAHQIQFQYFDHWYENQSFESDAEYSRTLELEADFFAGYYMTHKRGATYNWKRAEEFFELYYQSGDCSFEFEQHHGTPIQRRRASYEGFLLAESARKKGHILTPEVLHEYFINQVLPKTVNNLQYL